MDLSEARFRLFVRAYGFLQLFLSTHVPLFVLLRLYALARCMPVVSIATDYMHESLCYYARLVRTGSVYASHIYCYAIGLMSTHTQWPEGRPDFFVVTQLNRYPQIRSGPREGQTSLLLRN